MPTGLPIPDPTLALLPWAVVLVACAVGCVTDLRARRLPNALTLVLWVTGLVYSGATGDLAGLGLALLASVLLAVPYVILWLCAGGGAGDAKLMAGVGAWLGLFHGGFALAAVALVGGLAAVVWSLAAGDIRRMVSRLSFASTGLIGLAHGRLHPSEVTAFMPPGGAGRRIPYGVAIFLGAASAFVGATLWHA